MPSNKHIMLINKKLRKIFCGILSVRSNLNEKTLGLLRLTIFLQLKTGTLQNKGLYQIYKKIIFAKKLKAKLIG